MALRLGALLLALAGAQASAVMPPLLQARLRVFKPECSTADASQVDEAVKGASDLLTKRCQIRLKEMGWKPLALAGPWCHLPMDVEKRSGSLQALAAAAKDRSAGELALFLLPSDADPRLSWALVDQSLQAACNSPQEPRFLKRFGSLFFTDLTWMQAQARSEDKGYSRGALLVAHEVLHALTQRKHPTGAEPGSVMADHVADLGDKVGDDWCACARQSPYLRKP